MNPLRKAPAIARCGRLGWESAALAMTSYKLRVPRKFDHVHCKTIFDPGATMPELGNCAESVSCSSFKSIAG